MIHSAQYGLISLLGKRMESRFNFEPCSYDIVVDSIYDLKNLGLNAYILHTPGHSFGSMSLIVDDEIALVGDTMFGILKKNVFPPYADDSKELINSWEKCLKQVVTYFRQRMVLLKTENNSNKV